MSAGAGDAVFDFEQLKGGVESAVQQVVLQVLKGQRFNAGRVSDWADAITRRGVDALTALSPNFKFIVTATISERCATPVDTARCASLSRCPQLPAAAAAAAAAVAVAERRYRRGSAPK